MSKCLFIIDTNLYAGNFEREMCAYLTGHVGDCGVGDDYAEKFRKETKKDPDEFFHNVIQEPDEHGCRRPATIWENPGWFNDGMGNEWRVTDTNVKKQLAAYVREWVEYNVPLIKQKKALIKELLSGKKIVNWTVAAAKREIKQHQNEIERARSLKKVSRCPAYMSVGIWFQGNISRAHTEFMMRRAEKFCDIYKSPDKKKLCIEGYRIMERQEKDSYTSVSKALIVGT